jgi:poly-gamma-glutamate capsule biosynthesis protein CapA/YwtB (metallophosphatase superfamily)
LAQILLFLCGDVMTGRGIDQILPQPSEPAIHERYVQNAITYVQLAEEKNGPIPRSVDPSYIWGDALEELDRVKPQARIINLETAVTSSEDWLGKGINYRMNPKNVTCLSAAAIDCCALANNHVLDWGEPGLVQTLDTLHAAGLKTAGAGKNRLEAQAPAALPIGDNRRVLVFSLAAESSGVPANWAATDRAPGVDILTDLSQRTVERITRRVASIRQAGDFVVASVHWGSNWGYAVSPAEVHFAHALIEHAGVDLFHGHSSHHPKGLELFHGKLIIYGCGDFINDYEGITGYEPFRGDLGCMYFPRLDANTGQLLGLDMVPMQTKRFRVQRASETDAGWLCSTLDRESRRFGASALLRSTCRIELQW